MPNSSGPYEPVYAALHSLLTAVVLSTGATQACLISPEEEPDCVYIAASDEKQPMRDRKYSARQGDVAADVCYGDELVGRLVVAGAPDGMDSAQIEAFAATAGHIMWQATKLAEALGAMEETRVISELAQQLGEVTDVDHLLQSVVKGLRQLMNADYASIARVEADGTTRWLAMDGNRTDEYKNVVLPPGKGIAYRAVAAGQPITLEDLGNTPSLPSEEPPIQMAEGGVSALGMPLILAGAPSGALIVGSRTPRHWKESEIRLATIIANGSALILEQARAAAEQRSQREILEKVVENFPGILLVMEPLPDSRILFASKQFNSLLPEPYRSGAPVTGINGSELGFEGNAQTEVVGAMLEQMLRTGEPVSSERYEYDHPNAGKTWWNWSGVPIKGGSAGDPLHIMFIATEVSEAVLAGQKGERAAEEAQARAEELETVIQQMADGVVIFNKAGQIIKINPAGQRLLGRGVAEGATPDQFSDLYGLHTLEGEPFTAEELPSSRARRGETVVGEQMAVKRPDSEEIIISASVSPLKDGSKQIVGAVAVFHDITQEKMVERLKDEFLSIVSHELRTPLTAIMGHTDLLLRGVHGTLSERQGKALGSTKANADRLLRLINDLLDVSRLEARSVTVEAVPANLGDIIARTVTQTRVLAADAGVTIENNVPQRSLPEVMAEHTKLEQIIENLMTNALKFTPAGGKVTFDAVLSSLAADDPAVMQQEQAREAARTARGEAASQSVIVMVKDTGKGLEADQLTRIWDRFYQVDSTTKRRTGGAGLGLAIVRNLIELHDGQVWAQSEGVGKGSVFSFTLPLATVRTGASQVAGERQPKLRPAARQAETRSTVLVVEDDTDQREIVREMLELDGYKVVVAEDGAEALELATSVRPSAIVLDVILPIADGWEVLHRLKSDPDTKDIPVLVVSVVDQPRFGKKLGASDYLIKPLSSQRLRATIHRLVDEHERTGNNGNSNGQG